MKEHITTERLSAYIDGAAEKDEVSRIESHLSFCGQCRAELELLKKMIGRMKDMKEIVIRNSDRFVKDTMARIRRRRKIRIFRHALMPAAAAAAILVIAGVGIFEQGYHHATKVATRSTVSSDAPSVDYEDVVGTSVSEKSILATLQKNNAVVTKKTNDYVEATVRLDDYQRIRSSFGFTQLPGGFIGNGLDLASVGDDQSVSPADDQNMVKIRIRRK